MKRQKERYLFVFVLAFFMSVIIFLPFVIFDKGIFIYYGDYNVQQIPFYKLAHEAVLDGNIFWNWNTDLGANFIGSYSFYLLGSPFFYLTLPFPNDWVPYLMPILLSLKTATAALTSYAFIRRFVRNTNSALIGALLYAFSGFMAYNVFFNHFHEAVAFFPLLLIALEETVINNRKGLFALAIALCVITNYFFFAGQAVFLLIYFILRCMCKDFKLTVGKFFTLAFETIIGMAISAFLILPSALAIMDNPRVDRMLYGWNMLFYNDVQKYGLIIQSFFFPPDIPARPVFFPDSNAKWSSVAGFLPLFSMAGVIAFMRDKKKHWARRLIFVCMFMAFIPVLNSTFYALNSSYYARWFYMPILIMAMMTAITLDEKESSLGFGIAWTSVITAGFALIGILPSLQKLEKGADGTPATEKVVWGAMPSVSYKFWINVLIAVVCILGTIYILLNRKNKHFWKQCIVAVCLASFVCTGSMLLYGRGHGPYRNQIVDKGLEARGNFTLDESEFFRIDVYEGMDNYPMYWGYPSIQAFHSVVPGSIFEFYSSMDVERSVGSRPKVANFALRGLTSVKYLMQDDNDKEPPDLPGFEYYDTQNKFRIYENKYFVPMGYTYDEYITDEQWSKTITNYRDRVMMKALYLTDEQISLYGHLLENVEDNITNKLTRAEYLADCEKRAAASAYSFEIDNRGFTAKSNLDRENLMVFSVPFDKGWSANVNGQQVKIEKVNSGLMAVPVPMGEAEIRFNYVPPGLYKGIVITVGALFILIIYMVIWHILGRRNPQKYGPRKYHHLYDKELIGGVKAHNAYIDQMASSVAKFPDKDTLSKWDDIKAISEQEAAQNVHDGEPTPEEPIKTSDSEEFPVKATDEIPKADEVAEIAKADEVAETPKTDEVPKADKVLKFDEVAEVATTDEVAEIAKADDVAKSKPTAQDGIAYKEEPNNMERIQPRKQPYIPKSRGTEDEPDEIDLILKNIEAFNKKHSGRDKRKKK